MIRPLATNTTLTKKLSPEGRQLTGFLRMARVEPLRSMRKFAEEEIIIPDGPYKGRKFSCLRQPYSGLWFDLIDSGKWQRFFACGPTQSGKSLCGFVIPAMYHLFEIQETVICGLPQMDMAGDKWREDFLPAITASRFAKYLPDRGAGSRGGNPTAIKFTNGATLKFMGGGGDDKQRSAFTARVVVITEVDGLDTAGELSREADPITQMEARTMSFGDRKRIYGECTVSIEQGRIWQEYIGSTKSRIALPCPHCRAFVTPGREHLTGWHDATHELEAKQHAHFCCPECAKPWTPDERRLANETAIVLHDGQTAKRVRKKIVVEGDIPQTETLGFRWSAVNNLFQSPGAIGAKEWKASRSDDDEDAEKELQQFYWTIPHKPDVEDLLPLDSQAIYRRIVPRARGIVPEGTEVIVVGADVGQYLIHWSAIAWQKNGTGHILDYGRIEVPSQELGLEQGLLNGLRQLRAKVLQGYGGIPVRQVFVDSGWQTETVVKFCRERECAGLYRPTKGFGTTQYMRQYTDPKGPSGDIRWIGRKFHVKWVATSGANLVEVDVDYWKSFIHARIAVPLDQPGALTLFDEPDRREHMSFARHLTAERQVKEFVEGKGEITRWQVIRQNNHWLDAVTLCGPAGYLLGVRLGEISPSQLKREQTPPPAITMPDGRPFLITERQ